MTDTYRNHLLNRFRGGTGQPAIGPVADIASNAARETALRIAVALKTKAPPGIGYTGGGAPVAANEILGQRGPVVVPAPLAPYSAQPMPNTGSPLMTQGGSSDTIMTVPSGGYAQPTPPTITRPLNIPPRPVYPLGGYPGENRTGLPKYQPSTYGEPYGPTEGDPTAVEAPHGTLAQDISGTLNKAAEELFTQGFARPVGYAAKHVPYGDRALDALNKAYEWNAGRIGDDILAVATGEQAPDEWPIYNLDNHAPIWAADPMNKARIALVAEQGLDINGDGVTDVRGGDAVYMMYIAEEHPGFIDQMVTQMEADPLFAASIVIPAAGAVGKGAAVGRETAELAGLARQAQIFRAIEAAGAGAERVGGVGLKVADLPFTVPIEIARQMGRVATRLPDWFTNAMGRTVAPAERTAAQRAINEAADAAEMAMAAQAIPVYPGAAIPTPGVTEAPLTPYGGRAYPEGTAPVAIDPATGAPVGTPLTDLPVTPKVVVPMPGGGVGVVDGPITKTPYGTAATNPLPTTGLTPGVAPIPDYLAESGVLAPDPWLDASEAESAARVQAGTAVPSDLPPEAPPVVPEPAPIRRRGTNPVYLGNDNDVRIYERNDIDGQPVYEVQIKQDKTQGGWKPKNVVSETFTGAEAAVQAEARATAHVRGAQPPTPVAEAAPTPTEPVPIQQRLAPTPSAPTPAETRWSLRQLPGGRTEAAATRYPAQWAQARQELEPVAAAYEHAVDKKRTTPLTDTALQPGAATTEGYADRAIYAAEFNADVQQAMRRNGIPVADLPNLQKGGPRGNAIERRVRSAIYDADEPASVARNRLYREGYMRKEAPRERLHAEIMAGELPVTPRYKDGYIQVEGVPYTNTALKGMSEAARRDVAERAVVERTVAYERGQRITEARRRLLPEGERPVLDPVTIAAKDEIVTLADEAIAKRQGLVDPASTDEPVIAKRIAEASTSLDDAIGKLDNFAAAAPSDARVSLVERLKSFFREVWDRHQRLYAVHPSLQKFMQFDPQRDLLAPSEASEALKAQTKTRFDLTDELDIQAARGEIPQATADYLKLPVRDYEILSKGKWTPATPSEFAAYAEKRGFEIPASGNFDYKRTEKAKPSARVREMTRLDLLEKTRTTMPAATDLEIEQAFAHRMRDLIGPEPKPYTTLRKPLEIGRKSLRHLGRAGKSIALNNPFNIVKAIQSDMFSDSARMYMEGHGQAAIGAMLPFGYDAELRGKTREIDRRTSALGMDIPNEIKVTKGRSEIETGTARTATHDAILALTGVKPESRAGKIIGGATNVVDYRFGRDARATMDDVRRQAVFVSEIDKRLPGARQDFRQEARRFGVQNGIAPSSVDAYLYDLGDEFDATQVRTQMTELANDAQLTPDQAMTFGDHLGQRWQAEVNSIRDAANAEQKRVLFSYERTNLDQAIGNFIFYHYWMSRAIPAYARIALRNPEIAALWIRAWGEMSRRAKEQDQPGALQGYLRVMGSGDGFYGSVNPWNVMLPVMDLRPDAQAKGKWDKLTQFVLVSPIIQATASVIGLDNTVVDPLMLYTPRNAAMATVNKVRASRGQGPYLDDPYENLLRSGYQFANDLVAGSSIPFSKHVEYQDPAAFTQSTIRYAVATALEDETGVPREQWGKPEWDRWRQAILDGELGHENALYQQGFDAWADATFTARALNAVIPGGFRMRYGPKDVLTGKDYTELTPEELHVRDMMNAGSPEVMAQTEQLHELDQLGTENGRQGYKLYNEIAFADDINPNDALEVDGEVFRGWQIMGMTDGQRKRLADRWLAQYEGVPEEVETYRGLRDDFLKANPEAGDFKEYQKGVGGYEGGITAWRTMFARKPENKDFADAMAKHESYQRSLGKTGDVLKAELDQWALSPDAYNAANGYRTSIYGPDVTPRVPDYGFATGEEATTKKGGEKKDPMTVLADHLKSYREKMDEALKAMNAAGYAVTEADLLAGSPLYRAAMSNYGVPQIDRDISLYLQWSAHNDGASIDEYIAYLENLAEQAA